MKPDRVPLPGLPWAIAASGPDGPLLVSGFAGSDLDRTALTAVDPAGTVLWRHDFDGRPGPPRVGPSGTVWLAGPTLVEVSPGGEILRSVRPEHEAHEHLGALVLLPDGFLILWLPAGFAEPAPPGRSARVARHTATGAITWSTPLTVDRLAFPGVVEIGAHTGGRARPVRPWRPRTVTADRHEPLLVSADRVLAGIADYGSGIGVVSILDLATGGPIVVTEPAPYGHKAAAGDGTFLVGRQGYGAFATTAYDRAGRVTATWPSHARLLVDRHGTIRGPESRNTGEPSRFRTLHPDGSLGDGPVLGGHRTGYPAVDAGGTTVLWHDGRLLTIDPDHRVRTLFQQDDRQGDVSRVLLLAEGRVAVAVGEELLLFGDTGLADLDPGPWPCGDAGPHGNPVTGRTRSGA